MSLEQYMDPTGALSIDSNRPGPSRVVPGSLDVSTHTTNQGNSTFNAPSNTHYGANIHYGATNVLHVDQRGERSNSASVIAKIARSHNAEYDMTKNAKRGPCTPETRTALLKKLVEWAKSSPIRLFWLTGIAGTGKTTVSFSFSDLMAEEKALGASFFCSRSLQDCRDLNLIISTIAYQLAMRYPAFKQALTSVLENDPDIFNRSLNAQLRILLIEPWNSCAQDLPKDLVIVIDALDECDGDQSLFIKALFDNITRLPFKILLSSRPDFFIRESLRDKDPSDVSTCILHEVEKDLVEADIAKYLEQKLSNRVSADLLNTLKVLSGTLFIVAATFVRLLTGGNTDPRTRFERFRTSIETQTKALEPLDNIYQGVLCSAFQEGELWDEEVQGIKDVLFTVVYAMDPLTREELAGILGLSEEDLDRRLDSLHSVLSVPSDRKGPIVIFHSSFADFIRNVKRCGRFYRDPEELHSEFAQRCLSVLSEQLHENLCGLLNHPSFFSLEDNFILSQISPALRYAAGNWAKHWDRSGEHSRTALLPTLQNFVATHTLHWFEFMILRSSLLFAISQLEIVLIGLDQDTELSSLVFEYLKFAHYFSEHIQEYPTDIYHISAWIPSHAPLRSHNAPFPRGGPSVLCGLAENWPRPDRVIKLDPDLGIVYSIAVSRDGFYLVFGSQDGTIGIWDAYTLGVRTLFSHKAAVNSLVIAGDEDSIIASGSSDQTIKVFDVRNDEELFSLNVCAAVMAVDLSGDGKWIVSGDVYGLVCIWDAPGRQLFRTLAGHNNWIRSVVFTPDSSSVISGSSDGTARVWDTRTWENVSILKGHTDRVLCIACSPRGDRVLTGSGDNTARLWNLSGEELQVFRAHSDWVNSVAFLLGGEEIITGSSDGTLCFWNHDSETSQDAPTQKWIDAGNVNSIASFPSEARTTYADFASCAGSTISLWNIRMPRPSIRDIDLKKQDMSTSAVSAGHSTSVTLSADGRQVLLIPSMRILMTDDLRERVVLKPQGNKEYRDCGALSASARRAAIAAFDPDIIELWEFGTSDGVQSGARYISLEGHSDEISSLAFSHDESRLVSTSFDDTIRIWDAVTGKQTHLLQVPTDSLDPTADRATFSHDNRQIASSSREHVDIWDAHSGNHLYHHQLDRAVLSVAFVFNSHYLVVSLRGPTQIINYTTGTLEHQYEFYYFTMLHTGISYMVDPSGWVCSISHLGDEPHKVLWIPPHYRTSFSSYGIDGRIFTTTSQGIQVCLPRHDGLVTLIIPHNQ